MAIHASNKAHSDTLPPLPSSSAGQAANTNSVKLGKPELPYAPFTPPPAPHNSRYIIALQSLGPIAKQVIRKAVETPKREDGSFDMETSAAESWEEFGRILLQCKDAFYPLHKLDHAQYFLPLPAVELSTERYTIARQINVALLLSLLLPSDPGAQLSSYMHWVTFLAQLKETYLLLCAGREKKDIVWVMLDRVGDVCRALCLAVEAHNPRSTGLLTYRLIFSHSHLRNPQLTHAFPAGKVLETSDLPRFERTWTRRATEEISRLVGDAPPKLDDALNTLRKALVKDMLEGIVPTLGDYSPSSATPFASPTKPAVSTPAKPLAAASTNTPVTPASAKAMAEQRRKLLAKFDWNAPQADAIRLTESSSFAEVEVEVEIPVKGKKKKAGKGKGKGRTSTRKNGGSRSRTGTASATETETETDGDVDMGQPAATGVPSVTTIQEDAAGEEDLPDVDEVIAETQLPPPSTAPALPAQPILSIAPAGAMNSQGKKHPRDDSYSPSPTPRPAKRVARAGPSAVIAQEEENEDEREVEQEATQLPTPRVFFEDTPASVPAAASRERASPVKAAPRSTQQTVGRRAQQEESDDDEVPEEDEDEESAAGKAAAQVEEVEEEEVDQLRSSVPVPTPQKRLVSPIPGRTAARASTSPSLPQTDDKVDGKGKAPATREQTASPARPIAAMGKKVNRYATGGNELGRKPWTTVEDAALMSALQELHEFGGPAMKWKTILEWHGPYGTKSKTLKDRNNAQLKDRARNLYLKMQRSGQTPPAWLPDR